MGLIASPQSRCRLSIRSLIHRLLHLSLDSCVFEQRMNSGVADLTMKSWPERRNQMVSRSNYRIPSTKYCLSRPWDRFKGLNGSRLLGIFPGHERRIRCVRPIEVIRTASNKVLSWGFILERWTPIFILRGLGRMNRMGFWNTIHSCRGQFNPQSERNLVKLSWSEISLNYFEAKSCKTNLSETSLN